jgi:exodeoxyribonuclease V alpha subunit
MIFLQTHGVGAGYAAKIFKQYGRESIEVVKANPYRLAADIFGIGFISADRIADKLGFEKDSPQRVEAGILHVLHQLADEGNVYYPLEPLVIKCLEILEVKQDVVARALDNVVQTRRIIVEDAIGQEGGSRAVYLAKYYVSETGVAAALLSLVKALKIVRPINRNAIERVQKKLSITLAKQQIEAIEQSVRNKVMVITGGPGTGKTTIINSILNIFQESGVRILLAAPTGRAAKRMSETTGHEAKTIHRLLEFSPQNGAFQKNSATPLRCDLLIVDEVSMIDTILMHHLLKAVPLSATLILVGDINQLPSVGAGNVLGDIIASGLVPVVELNEIFRQAGKSLIIVNAHKINAGRIPVSRPSSEKLEDFYFIEREEPADVVRLIVDLVKNRVPKRFGLDPVDDIQVLTPMHKGLVGAGNLNLELQKALNSSAGGMMRGGRNYRVHDKVMQIKNNYDKEVFNGDIGKIVKIDTEVQEVVIVFDGRKVSYEFSDLDEVVPAYAVSIHKSQGSEYPAVIIPILTQHYVLLQRNLIYTAITRGKRLVVLVGTRRALAIAVKNNKPQKRFTHLKERLRSVC